MSSEKTKLKKDAEKLSVLCPLRSDELLLLLSKLPKKYYNIGAIIIHALSNKGYQSLDILLIINKLKD